MKALKEQEKTEDIDSLAIPAQCLATVSSPNLWVVDWITDWLSASGLDAVLAAADQKVWTSFAAWHGFGSTSVKTFLALS